MYIVYFKTSIIENIIMFYSLVEEVDYWKICLFNRIHRYHACFMNNFLYQFFDTDE